MKQQKTTKLTSCATDFEAQLLKGALSEVGIPSMLTNENFSLLYGGIQSPATGVDILVFEEDLERARQFLAECQTEQKKV